MQIYTTFIVICMIFLKHLKKVNIFIPHLSLFSLVLQKVCLINNGIKSFQFNSCIGSGKLPIDFEIIAISFFTPSLNLSFNFIFISEIIRQALTTHNTYFYFCHIKPTYMFRSVMYFKLFC